MTALFELTNGTSGKDARDTINSIKTSRSFPDVFKMWTHGDSKSVLMASPTTASGLVWARRLHPFNGYVAGTSGQSGKMVTTAAGQIGNDAILAPMIAAFQNGTANVLVWKGFTNDSTKTIAEDMAVFRKIHLAARNAGALLTVIMPVNPYGPADQNLGRKMLSINANLRNYAENNKDCWFIDSTPALIDPSSNEYETRKLPYPVMGSDGVHEGTYGAYVEGSVIAREFARRGVPRMMPDIAWMTDRVAQNTAENGNFLHQNGAQYAVGNTAGMQVTGGAGVTGAANWTGVADASNNYNRVVGTLNGTAAMDISRVPNDYYADLGMRDDLQVTRLTFSGTPSADFNIQLGGYCNIYQALGTVTFVNKPGIVKQEVVYRCNALTGVYAIDDPLMKNPGSIGASSTTDGLPPLSYLSVARAAPTSFTGSASYGFYEAGTNVRFWFRGGAAISGSIDIFSMVVRALDATNPTPAV